MMRSQNKIVYVLGGDVNASTANKQMRMPALSPAFFSFSSSSSSSLLFFRPFLSNSSPFFVFYSLFFLEDASRSAQEGFVLSFVLIVCKRPASSASASERTRCR